MFLEIPGMIMGEAILSFLGLGISAPERVLGHARTGRVEGAALLPLVDHPSRALHRRHGARLQLRG